MSCPIYLIIELLSRSHLLMSIYTEKRYLLILYPSGDIQSHTSFLDVFLTNFLSRFFPSPEHPANSLPKAHESVKIHTSGCFSLQTVWSCVLPKVLPIVKILLYQCRLGLLEKWICIASSVSFWVVPALHEELSIQQVPVM